MLSVQEIKWFIENDRRRIKRLSRNIDVAKADIQATKKSIKMWEGKLRKAKRIK